MDNRIFHSAWRRVKDHLVLRAVRKKIVDAADLLYYPLVHDFTEFAETMQRNKFGGDHGSALDEEFQLMVNYETTRWQNFERELDDFEQRNLYEARDLLKRLFYESRRLEHISRDLHDMICMCNITHSGHVVPRRPYAAVVFRHWHEARKNGEETELRLLGEQVYSKI